MLPSLCCHYRTFRTVGEQFAVVPKCRSLSGRSRIRFLGVVRGAQPIERIAFNAFRRLPKGRTDDKKDETMLEEKEDFVHGPQRRKQSRPAGRLCTAKYDRDGESPSLMDNCRNHGQASLDFSALWK